MSGLDGGLRVAAAGVVLAGSAVLSVLAVSWTGTAPWAPSAEPPPGVPVVAAPDTETTGDLGAARATGTAPPGTPGALPAPGAGPTGTATPVADGTAGRISPRASAPVAAAAWVARVATSTSIPSVALQAYADATLATQTEHPGCHLGWSTLAAIGAVESGHGTHGGTTLRPDGRPETAVVGPPLDGTRAITASAAGTAWHGDPDWEHAVGPMQFLPGTWARWGADADGDGTADPHDVQDAALAAARYLCAGGRDLATADGWWSAALSYNRDDSYAAHVLELADAYADAAARP
ncbi:lytic murein transglycosylase [Cellulomonas soli]|uniref:lytic transglycosylase domain-containing protein n=1 Tax=Cellulomonas soli TaxID=931535 RepID=UPI003F877832